MADFTDPAMDAYAYSEAVADELGEEAVEPYFEVLVGELFELVPGLRDHYSNALLTELKEEIAQREDPEYAHATITLIETTEDTWRNREGQRNRARGSTAEPSGRWMWRSLACR
jgi:hypothetical protein